MDRIDHPTAVDIGGGRRGFRSKDTVAGVPGTVATATHLNAIQEEIVRTIEGAGEVPDPNDLSQLLKTIRSQRTNYAFPAQVTGSANAIALTFAPAFPNAASMIAVPMRFIVESVPTSAITLNVSGLGPAPLVNAEGVQLGNGSLRVGQIVEVAFDGTSFQVISPLREARPGQFYLIDQIVVPSDVAAVDWAIPVSANNVDILRITAFMKGTNSGSNLRISTNNGVSFRAGAADYKAGYVSFTATPSVIGSVYYNSDTMGFSSTFDVNSDGFSTVEQTIFRGGAGLRGQAFGNCYGLTAGVGFTPTQFQSQVAAVGRITNLRWLPAGGTIKATTRIIIEGLAP